MFLRWIAAAALTFFATISFASEHPDVVSEWENITCVSKCAVSLEVCVEPPMRRSSKIHDQLFNAIRDLHADYTRYSPWYPYPKLAVAELEAPRNGETFWDFSLIDPLVEDFVNATNGLPIDFNFSTIPEWMFETDKPVAYPSDPDEIDWDYEQGSELRDPSMKEVADYWVRLANWYTQGGFKDEYGKFHASGHHYKLAYWEVLNEPDFEHRISPELYTRLYDVITRRLKQILPDLKIIGMALADPVNRPDYFHYFLDPKNHAPGIPIDMISYHFYSMPDAEEPLTAMQYTIFDQADKYLTTVRYIDSIRTRLSPHTGTYIDELGSMLPDPQAAELAHPIPDAYWNLAGAMWAYTYAHLAAMGIDVVGGAELIDYPGQFAATTMVHWATGQPTARYWVLKILRENMGPGDKFVKTTVQNPQVFAQAFISPEGKHKLLMVNKRDRAIDLAIPGLAGSVEERVDQVTGFSPAVKQQLGEGKLSLPGFAVAIVTFP